MAAKNTHKIGASTADEDGLTLFDTESGSIENNTGIDVTPKTEIADFFVSLKRVRNGAAIKASRRSRWNSRSGEPETLLLQVVR